MTEKRKLLIIGGNGFVGSSLSRALNDSFEVYSTYHQSYTPVRSVVHVPLPNLTEKDPCDRLIQAIEPNIVVYCVGNNNEADAEKDPRTAQMLHSGGLTHLIHAVDLLKAKFIYISSDFVFSGLEGNFCETDSTIPGTQIGKAKVGGENMVKTRSLNHLIIRCAPLLGRGTLDHTSWLDHIRENIVHHKKVLMPSRGTHNPVHISFLAEVLKKAIEADIRNRALHVGGLTKISLYEMTKLFLEKIGLPTDLLEASDVGTGGSTRIDYSMNFTETLKLIEAQPLFLE